ncbi:putative inorganic diphosphatase [Helianthus anomalus]
MVIFAVLIFVFLRSIEGFSTSSKTCTYDATKMCKPALMTAEFSTVSFLLGAVTSVHASQQVQPQRRGERSRSERSGMVNKKNKKLPPLSRYVSERSNSYLLFCLCV